MATQVGDRAVVLGAGMAGLLAARVLADAYGEVVVVDRDQLGGVTTARRGVPQGSHVHGLLARGQQILDELFPGFTEEAVAAGIPTGDLGELRWFFNGKRLQPASTGLTCVSASRPVLESHVRNRVAKLPNVRFHEGYDIVGLNATADQQRVTGVRLSKTESGEESAIEADLVVDATGRGSRSGAWLEELGYQRPSEDRVRIDLTYTTRHYRLKDERRLHGDLSINPVSGPSHHRGAFFSRIENGECVLSLTSVLGDSAPADPEGFLEFIRSLPVPDIYDVIHDAEPLDEPAVFRFPASIRRRYESLTRFPDGLLLVGDAFCSFNPVYGQGMTVAALEALTLRDHLSAGAAPVPMAFLRDVAAVIDVPWQISASGDLSFPEVPGERPEEVQMANAYMAQVQAAATRDGEVTRTFMRVAGLVDPPTALMDPAMMARVAKAAQDTGESATPPDADATGAAPVGVTDQRS